MERINMMDGKQVGEKLGRMTIATKDAAIKGGSLIKSMFTQAKQYVTDVAQSYEATVSSAPSSLAMRIAARIASKETFEEVMPDGTKVKFIEGVPQCEE